MLEKEFDYLSLYSPNFSALTESQRLYRERSQNLSNLGNEYLVGNQGENLSLEDREQVGANLILSGLDSAKKGLRSNQYQIEQVKLQLEALMYHAMLDSNTKG